MSDLQPGGAVVQAQPRPAHSISSAVSAAALERNRQPQQGPAVQQGGPSQPEGQAGLLVNPNAASVNVVQQAQPLRFMRTITSGPPWHVGSTMQQQYGTRDI